jgi:hypothetical protein
MEIQKANLRSYDARYIQAIQSETARSIKPNIFRDIPEEVQLALWLTDLVELSPEAQLLLKKFRKKDETKNLDTIDWRSLLEALEEMQHKLREKNDGKKKEESFLNLVGLPVMCPPLQKLLSQKNNGKPSRKTEASKTSTASLVEKMIVRSTGEETNKRLVAELEPLGYAFVETCYHFGVKIAVLRENEKPSQLRFHFMALVVPGSKTFDGRLRDEVRGSYFSDRRLLILGEEQIGIPTSLIAVHELAHAYDHAFSEKHQRVHRLSTQLWNLFSKSRKGFVTSYASTNPAEYFAESVTAYFIPKRRTLLEKLDPSMFEFLSALFTR